MDNFEILKISALSQCSMKFVPRWVSQRSNRFYVGSVYDEICSVCSEHILIEDLETGCNFPYAERLYVGWAYMKLGYPLTEQVRKMVNID